MTHNNKHNYDITSNAFVVYRIPRSRVRAVERDPRLRSPVDSRRSPEILGDLGENQTGLLPLCSLLIIYNIMSHTVTYYYVRL